MERRLSASRLINFLGCEHYAALWLSGVIPPEENNPALDLLREKGLEHEAAVLSTLQSRYGAVVSIPTDASLEERGRQTLKAIADGAPLIYQGALFTDSWIGFPDFLIRSESTHDGRIFYEPEDAKLARRAKPEHVMQLGVYAELLEQTVGLPRGKGAIHVANGEPQYFDLRQTQYVTKRLVGKFEAFARQGTWNTTSRRCAACDLCPYSPRCESEWRASDSPVFVAGVRGNQLITLEQAGISTLTELASLPGDAKVAGMGSETLTRIVSQARLQRRAITDGKHSVETLPIEPGRGFTLLPPPDPGDLFFDMEGDPHFPEGLEYLFGIWGPLGKSAENIFVPIWGHDAPGEKEAFEKVMRLFTAHMKHYPKAHIYHYAQYEPSALRRLAMRHATMEAELDELLRGRKFVDLYKVARQGIRASTEGYSLKDLEKIYWGQRSGDVTNAGDSIVEYERWRVTGDPAILESIARYNEDDCVSTAGMRAWLEGLRPDGAVFGLTPSQEEEPSTEYAQRRAEIEERRRALAAAVRASHRGTESLRELIAELLWFHQRANKPQWWAIFDRQTWTAEEMIDDAEGIGGLAMDQSKPQYTDKRSYVATYRFPPQDTKLKVGSSCYIAETTTPAGTIVELDPEGGSIVLRRAVNKGDYPATCNLAPPGPINQEVLEIALSEFAQRFVSGDTVNDRAILDLLQRELPRIAGKTRGSPVISDTEDLVAGTVQAVSNMDCSSLFIQGPPGTGKTYTTSHAILALLKLGKRVAVSSNSHKAINNLLLAVEKRAAEVDFEFVGAKKGSRGDDDTAFEGDNITTVWRSEDVDEAHRLVGGTAFHFALPAERNAYDYLFVDEAGQVALGNLIAMAGCARNIVLVGDQMQLPQPVQGVHPGETGLSCLDYLLQGRATVQPEMGILLNISWRMHPSLCQLISNAVYDGRLSSHPDNERRRIVLKEDHHPALQSAGVKFIRVEHEGCLQSSQKEAMVVKSLIQNLLDQQVLEKDGSIRPLGLSDVLVVAPFNMQVDTLKRHLPEGTRVGTVDKFQGQEAAVAIVSMATSHGEDAPRGTAFLFNRNRFNVALSRAQCLAIVVHGTKLLDAPCGTLDDLIRLNLFAWVEHEASHLAWSKT